MSKLRLGVVAVIIAATAALFPSPASAHTSTALTVFVGTASVGGGPCGNGGLLAPANPLCPIVILPSYSWSFSSNVLDVIVGSDMPAPLGANRVGGSGNLNGYCGGTIGSGNVVIGAEAGAVTFVTVGGTGVLVGVNGSVNIVALFQARPLPTAGGVPCVTEGAVQFLVVGAGAVVATA